MELTFIGMIQIVIGAYVVLVGSVRSAVIFLVASALFEGSAAILLPGLGGSSIPPVQFALMFTTLRILAPKGGYLGLLPNSVIDNKWFVLFAVYGIASAYLAPRIFDGAVNVFPMRPSETLGPFDTIPLRPTAQNLTAAFYLLGALLLTISGYVFARIRSGPGALVSALLLASWFHVASGLVDLATRGSAFEAILTAFRNGGYSMLDHSASGFIRIRGVLPEASTYAGLGFTLFLACAEFWYRSIRPVATGLTALAMALMLVLSTASTAYVAMAAYGLFFVFRAALFPHVTPRDKLAHTAIAMFGILFVLSVLIALAPGLPIGVYELVMDMTFGKSDSFSGQQRLFWALQGWDSFIASYGLGIGPGSFRSSSIVTAILGSTGVIGTVSFALYLKAVLQASKRSTWSTGPSELQSIGGALAVAAFLSLVPAAVSSPNVVPRALFSIMAGAAIAMRSRLPDLINAADQDVAGVRWKP
ncbi:glycoside hydrolase [Altererythrobacter sp. BO-6]|uniref:glycoside hydrolase n=1 Tax=Altererythrobacter sp. BO-6 TaxID=2604537 RepID=UPI0013E1B276|nr:glycoside hydrolase [Altererythrobacter sp. BO-6]QIG53188.1 glycoside hydrolase [Altererythrobacter sp. BO-6]